MTDLAGEIVPRYYIDAIEFRDRMCIVNFAENDDLKSPFQQHKSIVVPVNQDEDCDIAVNEIFEGICDLIDAWHVAKRNPPRTRQGAG